MGNAKFIHEADARAITYLLGETAAIDGDHAEKKRYLMNGLCELIKADAWTWGLACQTAPGSHQTNIVSLYGGFDEERFAVYLKAVEQPEMAQVALRFFEELNRRQNMVTMRREDIDPDNLAESSGAGTLWDAADIGSLIMSMQPLEGGRASGVGIYRKLNAPAFTKREVKIAHIVLTEVRWLYLSGWPKDQGVTVPKLYPQQRIVLNLLLDSMSRKQIAAQMHLSEHTVSGYVKDVYRHFGVNSHPELMKRFMDRRVKGHSKRSD